MWSLEKSLNIECNFLYEHCFAPRRLEYLKFVFVIETTFCSEDAGHDYLIIELSVIGHATKIVCDSANSILFVFIRCSYK